jgi:hypothetical protein
MNFQLNYLPSYTERILMNKQFEHLKPEFFSMIDRLKYLRSELDDAGLGMAARELDDAARSLDMAIAFIQEALEDSSED